MKGQAAVEYLMTYGWAILVLLIVVAALFSTGVMTPNYLVSEECSFGNNLRCVASVFNEGGNTRIILTVYNGFPYKISVDEVSLQTADGSQQFLGFGGGLNISSGANQTFEASLGGPALAEGSVKRFAGNITYVSCAPELGANCSENQHMVSGRVTAKVIE
ncbi:MAG: hypothetical protein AB1324_07670 [Candidatus Micrarchaeota archaeon]